MSPTKARLWGPLLRIGHWAVALAVLVAVLTAGRPLGLHSRAGYIVLGYVLIRAAWSAFGPAKARLWSAIGSPAAVVAEIRGVLTRKAEKPEGLGPFGAFLVVALLATLGLTGLTGVATLAVREGQGPLSIVLGGFYTPPKPVQTRQDIPPTGPDVGGTTIISRTDRIPTVTTGGVHPDIRSGGTLKAIHGFLSDLSVWLAVAHVLWVLAASFSRGENLILSMVTGVRHAAPPMAPSLPAVVKATTPEPAAAEAARPSRRAQREAEKEARRAERRSARGGGRRQRTAS